MTKCSRSEENRKRRRGETRLGGDILGTGGLGNFFFWLKRLEFVKKKDDLPKLISHRNSQMTSDAQSSCSMELDPNTNPLFSMDDHFPMFQEDSLIQIGEDKGNDVTCGIAAADVSSLLEQFEEASNSLGGFESQSEGLTFGNDKKSGECSSGRSTPTKDILDKIKSKQKTKSAILLPMGMPSKRGRGSAVTMTSTCATPRMKRILLQTSSNVDIDTEMQAEKENSQPRAIKAYDSNNKEILNVNLDYYMGIVDHDYCVNVPKMKTEPPEKPEHYPEDDVLILEDGEVLEEEYQEMSDIERQPLEDSGIADTFKTSEKSKHQRSRRNYRNRREDSPVDFDKEKYFNKIPSYYTALSLNSAKPPKKSAQESKASSLRVQDFFEPNPAPKSDNSVYNKLPAYYSCFTNSTKYDSAEMDNKMECSQESKSSSGYSSRSHSPYGNENERDGFESYRNRSTSRDLKIRGRRGRSRERRRRGSYSSSSRSRSRSSSSSMSRSRSRTRHRSRSYSSSDYSSRSRSRSYTRYDSRSRSRSVSKHRRYMSSRSRSREREREERKKIRDEEKLQKMKERRIVYVGKIPDSYTKRALRRRFERFGVIEEVSVHFRENGDNYGFVTFEYRCDAYAAVEKGNDVPDTLKFDLCFGGRRQFCEVEYADLDGINEVEEEYYPLVKKNQSLDFDELLRQAQASRHKK
ncbi:hypothetical protein FSP39_016258 [Pinctada imbricata]|uniref:RRM domain-containing protein n=1 Tax=Pinctada imbricata TaxID=66713 RepID=A0AA88Y6R3_PINIB|nr:hypothetical protein FSP39_016258 [Pinctada imbricata]